MAVIDLGRLDISSFRRVVLSGDGIRCRGRPRVVMMASRSLCVANMMPTYRRSEPEGGILFVRSTVCAIHRKSSNRDVKHGITNQGIRGCRSRLRSYTSILFQSTKSERFKALISGRVKSYTLMRDPVFHVSAGPKRVEDQSERISRAKRRPHIILIQI